MCKEGMRIYSKKGGGRTMGFTNPEGLGAEELKAALRDNVKQYQMEVLEGGPVAFTIKAYDEFIRYKGGIYEVGDTKGSSVGAETCCESAVLCASVPVCLPAYRIRNVWCAAIF